MKPARLFVRWQDQKPNQEPATAAEQSGAAPSRPMQIWQRAKASGITKEGFSPWVAKVLGKPKPSAELTTEDMTKLETALAATSIEADPVGYFARKLESVKDVAAFNGLWQESRKLKPAPKAVVERGLGEHAERHDYCWDDESGLYVDGKPVAF